MSKQDKPKDEKKSRGSNQLTRTGVRRVFDEADQKRETLSRRQMRGGFVKLSEIDDPAPAPDSK